MPTSFCRHATLTHPRILGKEGLCVEEVREKDVTLVHLIFHFLREQCYFDRSYSVLAPYGQCHITTHFCHELLDVQDFSSQDRMVVKEQLS